MARILVVDDSDLMRTYLKSTLERAGHTVSLAKNGVELLTLYEEICPDIVTLDIIMPVMNGVDACRALIKAHPDAKIVMCSSMGQNFYIREAIEAGARDFIIKPFDATNVVESVNKVLLQP